MPFGGPLPPARRARRGARSSTGTQADERGRGRRVKVGGRGHMVRGVVVPSAPCGVARPNPGDATQLRRDRPAARAAAVRSKRMARRDRARNPLSRRLGEDSRRRETAHTSAACLINRGYRLDAITERPMSVARTAEPHVFPPIIAGFANSMITPYFLYQTMI